MKDLTCNDSVKSQQGDNFLNKFVQKAQKQRCYSDFSYIDLNERNI